MDLTLVTVTMLDTVENANTHAHAGKAPYTLSEREVLFPDETKRWHRIDLLRKGETYALPDYQAEALVTRGFAALGNGGAQA